MTEEEVYRLPFDIKRHKSLPYHTPIEIMIGPNGDISYALPSHQEFLIKKAMKRNGWTREQLMDACPPEYYFDFMRWLIPKSGDYIPVWESGILGYPLTMPQQTALKSLKLHGLYRGVIPKNSDISSDLML